MGGGAGDGAGRETPGEDVVDAAAGAARVDLEIDAKAGGVVHAREVGRGVEHGTIADGEVAVCGLVVVEEDHFPLGGDSSGRVHEGLDAVGSEASGAGGAEGRVAEGQERGVRGDRPSGGVEVAE